MAPAQVSVLTGSVLAGEATSVAAERIPSGRCLELLTSATSGYLALSQGALPLVVPVTCALDGGRLLVRAGLGLLGATSGQPGVVAFHTSATSPDENTRWEVLVQGRAELDRGPEVAKRARSVPPALALVAEEATVVLSISIELITGREYVGSGGHSAGIPLTTKAKKEAAR